MPCIGKGREPGGHRAEPDGNGAEPDGNREPLDAEIRNKIGLMESSLQRIAKSLDQINAKTGQDAMSGKGGANGSDP